jgi:hypothetical protein
MRAHPSVADAAEVERLLARRNSKAALESAKELHKRLGTPATEALLLQAYMARAQAMLEHGMAPEAQALLAMVRERFPSAGEKVKDLEARFMSAGDSLEELLRPLSDPALSADTRARIERAIRTGLTDPSALARSTALDPENPLRRAAAALEQAFQAVTSGPVEDRALELPEISHRSPLAFWKPLLRAIACYYRREDGACEENLRAIDAESAPGRLVPALRAMLAGHAPESSSHAASALAAQAGGNLGNVHAALGALEESFERGHHKAILQRIREAVSAAQHECPEMVAPLRQHIGVRAMVNNIPAGAVTSAMGGLVSRDAEFCRLLARACETDDDALLFACMIWEEFRQNAIREGWFPANGPEAATLYLHMAKLAANLDPEEVSDACERFQAQIRQETPEGFPMPEVDLPFLDAGWLYERACASDPHAEAFESWLAWSANNPQGAKSETVAQAWHRALPSDPRPLLYLMREAESRHALKKALGYLEQAEAVDGLNPEVRRARFRLLARSVIHHLQQRKLRLAERELLKLRGLPQARENDRPACVAGLRRAMCLLQGDHSGAVAAKAELEEVLGGPRAGALAATGVAQLCGLVERLPNKSALASTQSWAEAAARACTVGNGLGFALLIPDEWQPEIFRDLSASSSPDVPALLALGAAALRQDLRELAYAVSAAGLARGGVSEARFLLIRAQALPEWLEKRRDDCLAAVIELARRDRDTELAGEALTLRRQSFLGFLREGERFDARQVKRVVDHERRSRAFRAGAPWSEENFQPEPLPVRRRRRKQQALPIPPQEELF